MSILLQMVAYNLILTKQSIKEKESFCAIIFFTVFLTRGPSTFWDLLSSTGVCMILENTLFALNMTTVNV